MKQFQGRNQSSSLGVEHASFEDLQKALSKVTQAYEDDNQFDISLADLTRLGLTLGKDSRKRREYLGDSLRIGYSNGKQLLKRLELFGISLAQVETAMAEYHN